MQNAPIVFEQSPASQTTVSRSEITGASNNSLTDVKEWFFIGKDTLVIPFPEKNLRIDKKFSVSSTKTESYTITVNNINLLSQLDSNTEKNFSFSKNNIVVNVDPNVVKKDAIVNLNNYFEGKGIELGEAKTYNKSETATNEKEEIFMLQEMYGSIIKFENLILKLSYLLTIAFLVLTLPIFLGYSSLVGVVMSLGLLLYVKIRRWERSEVYGRKSH